VSSSFKEDMMNCVIAMCSSELKSLTIISCTDITNTCIDYLTIQTVPKLEKICIQDIKTITKECIMNLHERMPHLKIDASKLKNTDVKRTVEQALPLQPFFNKIYTSDHITIEVVNGAQNVRGNRNSCVVC
jgi:hypothetical protein